MENKKKVKICTLTTISKTMDWFIVDSMRNLAKNGYDVTLVCNMEKGFAERNQDYAKCINLPMSRGVSLSDLIKMPWKLYKLFKREKYDVIYYTTPNVSLYASIAGWLAGTKCRFYNQCGLRYVSFEGKKRAVFKAIEKFTCKLSTTVREQSPMNRQFAIDEGLCPAKKISVVGIGDTTGVSLQQVDCFDKAESKRSLREKYGIPQKGFLYGYVGRVNADKGINELITAFCELQKKHDDIYLVLVGMIDDTNPILPVNMRIAKENDHIFLTGNVPPSEVYPHMSMFDVLTHPTYREGFGKVLQEAMGVQLPIITTNIPGPSEVVESGVSGILVKDHDAKDLAEKMERIYADKEMRDSIAKAGRKRAETYFDRPIMLNNILKDMNKTLGI
ncbi:glycosyltransferase family 4 protein [Phocaeicola sartorii]|uniref:glycosyltransferase family 4 protein n=1 Tax=Bacteroidaceae TaxID=815 RepID=UPI00261C1364|nr:glycosyltransferase family 4 protein [Phocaeicola sartorii]